MRLDVNGAPRTVNGAPDRTLLAALREDLGLTGCKPACGEGACGACTVLVGGEPARACTMPVAAVAGQPITTVEGLTDGGRLHAVQEAFLDAEALQCGYCTPGMILSAAALLQSTPRPTRGDIVTAMDGHVCRCGTYPRIIAAIEAAANGP